MKFAKVPVTEAIGAILAHGIPTASLSKGRVIEAGHVESLQAMGIRSVTVARLESDDIDEDTAAQTVAQTLACDPAAQGVRLTLPTTGRVNIMAMRSGILALDVGKLTALNRVDPMITCATLPDLSRVVAGTMLATIKVISYAVPQASLAAACQTIETDAPLRIATAVLPTATLIETQHPGGRIAPKARRVLEDRMDRLGSNLIEVLDVPHEEAAIAHAIDAAKGHAVFILTASATSDILDTAPTALRLAGGAIERFGMPVDPGNLLFLGACGAGRPVIGLPGCARSPAMNGADWVLERVICGLPIDGDIIAGMGVGGLLKETIDRGRPR